MSADVRMGLTEEQADEMETEMRRLESDPTTTLRAMRLFMQCPMPCGHAAGNLLTCPDPPFGCVVCMAREEIAAIQELYDATSVLQAVMTFTHETADLVKPEMDYACRRLMAARSEMRRLRLIEHVEALLVPERELPAPFNRPWKGHSEVAR